MQKLEPLVSILRQLKTRTIRIENKILMHDRGYKDVGRAKDNIKNWFGGLDPSWG